jgi:photosystem II stability/assembly factor-like uncharacterized protein
VQIAGQKYLIRPLCVIGVVALLLAFTARRSAGQTATRLHKPPVPSAMGAEQKYKAIWEPMNYPEDVQLEDVFFANDQVGWIAGKGSGGFIFHTTDGGKNWQVQLGDPHSNDADVSRLHFLDAVHGWAVQGGQLIRTTNGRNWQTIGPFVANNPLAEYKFTSVQDGFEVAGYYSGSTIFATHDGGRSWKPVYQCATTLQVNGLSRNVSCFLRDVYFPSPRVGYAVGGGFNDSWATIAKTTDGGATWKVIFATTDMDTVSTVFFTDENNGVIRVRDKRVYITADGGQSWQGATGSAEAAMRFADPSVGWSCSIQAHPGCSYTLDGGKSWTTRDIDFPAEINSYSVPRRDQVYVVGDHGMMYRYRIVPSSYTAQGILDAPLMPAYGGALNNELDHMRAHCQAIQAKLAAARYEDYPDPRSRSPQPHLINAAFVSYEGNPQSFTQDTSSPAALNAPASPVMQNCCGAELGNLQSSVGSFSQQVPAFSGEFKNLNLLFVGMNMLNDLLSKAHSIQAAFLALKQAPDLQSASLALQNFSGQVNGTSQTLVSGFQNLTLSDAAGTGVIANMAGSPAASAAPAAAAAGANANNGATAPSQNSTVSNTVNSAAQKAKQKLKGLSPF